MKKIALIKTLFRNNLTPAGEIARLLVLLYYTILVLPTFGGDFPFEGRTYRRDWHGTFEV